MRERAWLIVSVLFVASGCGDDPEPAPAAVPSVTPPPAPAPAPPREMTITKTHPSSGTWGTEYTVEGTALSLANEVTFETTAGEPLTVARNAKDVVTWGDGRITVKVPFPADGKVRVGGLDAGTFASTFAVSRSTFQRGPREPSEMMAVGPDTVVVVATRISSASAIEPTLYRMHRDADVEELPVTFQRAVLLRDETGPFAILETSTFVHARVALDGDGAEPVATADLPNERIVGSGSDATGAWLWTTSGTTVTRHRLAAGAWTPDRTVTGTSGSVRALAASDDGNLALFTTVQGGGLFDDYDVVYTQPAGGADAAFGSTAAIMGDVDDATFGYRVWAKDGGATVVRFCATDEDGVEFDGRSCFTWARQPSAAAFARVDFMQHDGTGADAATATCEGDTLVVTSGATKTPVTSPCRDVAAFARGTDGRPVFLAGSRGKYLAVLPKRVL